ncbi:MAG: TonB family protein [Bacteroidota bacterium]
MKTILPYFLEANGYLLVFLAFYVFVLKNETQFRLKRAFLLLALLVSVVFPWIPIESSAIPALFQSISHTVQSHWLPEIVITAGEKTSAWAWVYKADFWSVIQWVYLTGFVVFLLFFIVQLIHLIGLIRSAETHQWRNCWVAESNEGAETFSFFNFIFIGNTSVLTAQEKLEILRHEQVHASQWHSVDILLSNVISILFWFNPLVRAYKKIFIQLHEFEADARAVENKDVNEYCNLLARVALQSAGIPLANHFNHSLTIKRISMMKTMKKKMQGWKMAGLIALFPVTFFIISCQKQGLEEAKKVDDKPTTLVAERTEDQLYTIVEQMPEFPGGEEKLMKYLSDNIKYPEESQKKGTEGTVFVTFEVDEKGKVTNPAVVKGFDAACDQEAKRVIAQSPIWIPGKQNGRAVKVKYTLPIRFALANEGPSDVSVGEIKTVDSEMVVSFKKVEKNGKVTIEGKISNKEGSPLNGAIIVLAGTHTGTTSDFNGHFNLSSDQSIGELAISFVGYEGKKISF